MFVMPFGKHKDKSLIEILKNNEQYIRWFLGENEDSNNKFLSNICDEMFKILGTPRVKKKHVPCVLIDTSDDTCPF